MSADLSRSLVHANAPTRLGPLSLENKDPFVPLLIEHTGGETLRFARG
jgi:hypothetical protein